MPSIRIETCRPAIGTISQAGGFQTNPSGRWADDRCDEPAPTAITIETTLIHLRNITSPRYASKFLIPVSIFGYRSTGAFLGLPRGRSVDSKPN
jgi:hypothetical protein